MLQMKRNGGISMIIVVDEPTCQVKYGSVVAAPYVSELYEKILPYMEFKSNAEIPNIKIENYVGKTVEEASAKLKSEDISLEDAIKSYEEGIKYYKECSEILEKAEQKIETLTR